MSEKFETLSKLLIEKRIRAGIGSQTDFARLIKSTQQTVSRWEAGLSRPRSGQIPLIASVLNADVEELAKAAGYAETAVVATFDQPFPVDALSPESFERFCRHMVQALFPDAKTHRAGGQGHTQDGLDVSAQLPDGTKISFQCKRAASFGPDRVRSAIAAHTAAADRKVLLLSRVASPQARAEVEQHPDWELWDKDDIAHKLRQLPIAEQVRIVDIFFKGQRFALLGVDETGPWETSKETFAAFASVTGFFNHAWQLIGRKAEGDKLSAALEKPIVRAVLLTGTGGLGKTRLLKQVLEAFEAKHPAIVVRFLSRHEELTRKSLEGLGDREKLLVVDDAHDRTDLPLLFQYAADPDNHTRLVLALRPYGLGLVKAQAANFSFIDEVLAHIELLPLSADETEALAKQVLLQHGGPAEAAKNIAQATRDCPLATVLGAQIVAKERKSFDLAQHADSFRMLLMERFRDTIAGQIGGKSEAEYIKRLLKLAALLQPIHPEDASLLKLIKDVEGIEPHETARLLRLLIKAGVLFKRGGSYRLSPDILADYIIEDCCVAVDGTSSRYAEKVFDAATEKQIENLLVNLARLDWRRSGGDPSESPLLNGVWEKLSPQYEYSDPHISAVRSVAYYQPRRAIEFVEQLIRENRFLNQLPDILRYAAYNMEYLARACEALWELGRGDARELNPHPQHAIRILAELCEVQRNKPRAYNEIVVDFGLGLLATEAVLDGPYTPFDFLRAIFKTENHSTESKKFAVSFRPYVVNPEFVSALRAKVLTRLLELMSTAELKRAVKAAGVLGDAFSYPNGLFGQKVEDKDINDWSAEFLLGLKALESSIHASKHDPLVLIAIWRAIHWHARRTTAVGKAVNRIRALLDDSLDYRVLAALIDGYGHELRRLDRVDHAEKWAKVLDQLAADIEKACPIAVDRVRYIEKHLTHISSGGWDNQSSQHVLLERLFQNSADFALVALEVVLADPVSALGRFVPGFLAKLWREDRVKARAFMQQLLAVPGNKFAPSVAQAFNTVFRNASADDADYVIFEQLLAIDDEWTTFGAIHALRSLGEVDMPKAFALSRKVQIGTNKRLADELVTLFTWRRKEDEAQLPLEEVEAIFEKLVNIAELDGHWLEVLLAYASRHYPHQTAEFFKRRFEIAMQRDTYDFRPINHGPYVHVPLRFRESGAYAELLRSISSWLKLKKRDANVLFDYRAAQLFGAMFGPFDATVVAFFEEWLPSADATDLRLLADMIGETDANFILNQASFITKFLDVSRKAGAAVYKHASGALFSAAVSGVGSGTPGQPMDKDVSLKAETESLMQKLPRFSAAFSLYESLNKYARQNIERALREGEAYEDD